jgi:hypothetical protein
MTWLGVSIVLSLLLTIILNAGLRIFPDAGRRVTRGMPQHSLPGDGVSGPSNHRLWAPWKTMILGSVILTIVLNLVLWLT